VIYIWLALVGLVYVVMAVAVGKICAINSRWEKTVDQLPPRREGGKLPFKSVRRHLSKANAAISGVTREEEEQPLRPTM